jgi:hypothetical protein
MGNMDLRDIFQYRRWIYNDLLAEIGLPKVYSLLNFQLYLNRIELHLNGMNGFPLRCSFVDSSS